MHISHVSGDGQSTNSVRAAALVRTASSVQNWLSCPTCGIGTDFLKACRRASAMVQWGSRAVRSFSCISLLYPGNSHSCFPVFVVAGPVFSPLVSCSCELNLDRYS